MEIFEFLMILLSIIVGLGLAEILTGIGGILRDGRQDRFSWLHGVVVLSVFLALLQSFWESWSLRSLDAWTYPAMLLLLGSPILIFTIALILFPAKDAEISLEEHYFARARTIWLLAAGAVIVGVTFRPLAFGAPLFIADNLSSAPTLIICLALAFVRRRFVHYVLVPLSALIIALDTLTINYLIR